MEQAVWTVSKILQWTQQYFSGKGLENPRLDAEVLLCDVLGCRRIDLFMRLQQELQPEELKKFREFVLRRAAWEPLAYIIGRKTFLQWEFKVTPAVLIPRPETELLVEKLGEGKSKAVGLWLVGALGASPRLKGRVDRPLAEIKLQR